MGEFKCDKVLEQLQSVYPGLCVIIITGYPSLEDMRTTFKLKVFDYLAKPFSLAQLRQVLENVAEVLAVEVATLSDVVNTTVYLLDMSEFSAINEVWVEYFTENRPTRSAVAVAALPLGALIEVEAWAYAPVG